MIVEVSEILWEANTALLTFLLEASSG